MFLYGGNDGNNTVVPLDTAGYAQYAAVRTAASGMQLAQASLLPIQPASLGTPFGLHPEPAPSSQTLFNQRKLAVLANVGTLVQPTLEVAVRRGPGAAVAVLALRPAGAVAELGVRRRCPRTGWGGRIADKVAPQNAATASRS